jgi:hypothetical protein
LDVDGALGGQQVKRPVDVGSKLGTLLLDPPHRCEAEDLVAAAVGQNRAIPADELVQATALRYQGVPRLQIQVVGVAEDDFGAESLQIALRDRLDRAAGPDGHERGCLDDTVRRGELTATSAAVAVENAEMEVGRHARVSISKSAGELGVPRVRDVQQVGVR